MSLLRVVSASCAVLVFVLPACGIVDKLRGDKDAGTAADAASADAAPTVEAVDAAVAAGASVAATPPPSAPIVGACKAGDLGDCTNKCEKQKSQPSCVNLGIMFLGGEGGATRDAAKAATLFQGACNGGVGAGCDRFGIALHSGVGIQQDLPRAATTFSKGCDLKNSEACNQVALMNVRGEGGPRDTVKAVALFQKSCDLGDAFGCGNLANHFANGDGVPRDLAKAAALRKTACDKGDGQACRALASTNDAGAASVAGSGDGGALTSSDCAARRRAFVDACLPGCLDKASTKALKKTEVEKKAFCTSSCSGQASLAPSLAGCK
jgi:hypothetical protein